MTHFSDSWANLTPKPCRAAWDWARTQPDWQTAWNNCQRGDWMINRLVRGLLTGSAEHRKLMLTVIKIGRTSLQYTTNKRVGKVWDGLELWANGDSMIQLTALQESAGPAAWSARSARLAGLAAMSVAESAGWAAESVWAAAWAAELARSARSARSAPAALKDFADIVRSDYPIAPTKIGGTL